MENRVKPELSKVVEEVMGGTSCQGPPYGVSGHAMFQLLIALILLITDAVAKWISGSGVVLVLP